MSGYWFLDTTRNFWLFPVCFLIVIILLYLLLQSYTGNPPSDELIALRKETRRKILQSKGYIIPSLDNPYVIAKPPTRSVCHLLYFISYWSIHLLSSIDGKNSKADFVVVQLLLLRMNMTQCFLKQSPLPHLQRHPLFQLTKPIALFLCQTQFTHQNQS